MGTGRVDDFHPDPIRKPSRESVNAKAFKVVTTISVTPNVNFARTGKWSDAQVFHAVMVPQSSGLGSVYDS